MKEVGTCFSFLQVLEHILYRYGNHKNKECRLLCRLVLPLHLGGFRSKYMKNGMFLNRLQYFIDYGKPALEKKVFGLLDLHATKYSLLYNGYEEGLFTWG